MQANCGQDVLRVTDVYGTERDMVQSECGCCLEGWINGADADTGQAWVMSFTLPKAAVEVINP